MFKDVIKYTDYNGEERSETCYFNISKAEMMRTEMSVKGGYTEMMKRLIEEKDNVELYKIFENLVQLSYGVKSDDGKHFRKSPELLADFMSTDAYSELIMKMFNADYAAKFVRGIFPSDITKNVSDEEIMNAFKS